MKTQNVNIYPFTKNIHTSPSNFLIPTQPEVKEWKLPGYWSLTSLYQKPSNILKKFFFQKRNVANFTHDNIGWLYTLTSVFKRNINFRASSSSWYIARISQSRYKTVANRAGERGGLVCGGGGGFNSPNDNVVKNLVEVFGLCAVQAMWGVSTLNNSEVKTSFAVYLQVNWHSSHSM